MPKDDTVALQPTPVVIKQAPSSAAVMHVQHDPLELTITLRHVPQPAQVVKNAQRSTVTYQAFLVNTLQNTKTLLGSLTKHRAGTYQLFAEKIPAGEWNQVVICAGNVDSADLGLPLFEASGDFSFLAASGLYHTLPARTQACNEEDVFPKPGREQPPPTIPLPEPPVALPAQEVSPGVTEDSWLQPGTVLPEPRDFSSPSASSTTDTTESKEGLLQPGTVLPEGDLDRTGADHQPSISDFIAPQLPNHSLWLIYYEGYQLVGFTYRTEEPKKPVYIVHGIPGTYTAQDKPQEQGYDYWIENPGGHAGYWLRYATPDDSTIVHPYPVLPLPN
jgi:hypothetical protein